MSLTGFRQTINLALVGDPVQVGCVSLRTDLNRSQAGSVYRIRGLIRRGVLKRLTEIPPFVQDLETLETANSLSASIHKFK